MVKRQSVSSSGRRLYAEPVHHPAPELSRLVDLVLQLAEAEHRDARRTRATGECAPLNANTPDSGLTNEAEPKEH